MLPKFLLRDRSLAGVAADPEKLGKVFEQLLNPTKQRASAISSHIGRYRAQRCDELEIPMQPNHRNRRQPKRSSSFVRSRSRAYSRREMRNFLNNSMLPIQVRNRLEIAAILRRHKRCINLFLVTMLLSITAHHIDTTEAPLIAQVMGLIADASGFFACVDVAIGWLIRQLKGKAR